jgi:hypothetical protein
MNVGGIFGIANWSRLITWKSLVLIATLAALPVGATEIHGSVNAERPSGFVFVPDITVYVHNAITGVDSNFTRTDLTGHFIIKAVDPGTYQVCWRATGYWPGCGNRLDVGDETIGLLPLPIVPQQYAINGTAKLADGTNCYEADTFFGTDVTGQIRLYNNGVLIASARSNSHGEYILPAIPEGHGTLLIRANCEDAIATHTVTPAEFGSGLVGPIAYPNSRPNITSIAAFIGTQGVRRANVGDVLLPTVQATDPDGDFLTYQWAVQNGNGSVAFPDQQQARWTLPNDLGTYFIYVLVSDSRGGYASDKIAITAGSTGVYFSGRAIDWYTHAPVRGAIVTVNGASDTAATTDSQGQFFMNVAPDPGNRYVLMIKAVGYAMLSRIFDEQSLGGVYEMDRAQSTIVDSTLPIDITDNREEVHQREGRGARVILDPNSLSVAGPVVNYISTLNPTFRPIPGDYRAFTADGDDVKLRSFGAIFVEFRDSVGNPVSIVDGAAATLMFPVSFQHLPTAPPNIPMWTFDETSGIWMQEGQLELTSDEFGYPVYRGITTHFSTHNADIQISGGTCVRFRIDAVRAVDQLKIRITTPTPTPQVYDLVPDTDQYHAYFRVQKTSLTAELIDKNGATLPGSTVNVNLAVRPPHAGEDAASLPYPYDACGDPILLGITTPPYAETSEHKPYFLTGPYGAFNTPPGTNAHDMSEAYYAKIDPLSKRTKLGDFWSQNGFDPVSGAGGVRASYMNHNDLGLGRDMHCINDGVAATAACYVTNYGTPDNDPANADLAHTADKTKAVATVAMEYSPIEGAGPTNTVKFYVYQGGLPGGTRQDDAKLDFFGPKPVPQLCTVCHGGNYNPLDALNPTISEVRMGSNFREFDLNTFKFPLPALNHDYPPAVPDGEGSLNDFKALNDIVKSTLDVAHGDGIKQVIDAWYWMGGATPDFTKVIAGWDAPPQNTLYLDVVANSCRTCHIARDGNLRFDTFVKFRGFHNTIQGVVCGTSKVMPNSMVTYQNFWQSNPSRPGELAAFNATGWLPFGSCN